RLVQYAKARPWRWRSALHVPRSLHSLRTCRHELAKGPPFPFALSLSKGRICLRKEGRCFDTPLRGCSARTEEGMARNRKGEVRTNADYQPAGPQGPRPAEGQVEGPCDGAEPAEARRVHPRLYDD